MSVPTISAPARRLVTCLLAGDVREARRLARSGIREQTLDRWLADVLAPAMREVGRRWEGDEIGVADEHVAAAVAEDVLAGPAARGATATTSGSVVVACAEGEWHSLPARMVAQTLRAGGWHVSYLGPSLPPDALTRFLTGQRYLAVAVSCTMAARLPGVRRLTAAAHARGVPVLVGGAAFGRGGRFVPQVGADDWAATASDAATVLHGWREEPLAGLAGADGDEATWAAAETARGHAVAATGRTWPDGCGVDADLLTRTATAAVFVRSGRPLSEMWDWMGRVAAARGVDPPDLMAAGAATMSAMLARMPPADRARVTAVLAAESPRDPVSRG